MMTVRVIGWDMMTVRVIGWDMMTVRVIGWDKPVKQNLSMFGGDSEELERRVIIELIVGLAQRVKRHAFDRNVKLTL